MSKILELSSVSKEYIQGKTALKILEEVDLSINKAEMIGIIGSSGSGKSTLLHIAGLLDGKYSGEIRIDNKLIDHKDKTVNNNIRLHKLGFIYQYHHLVSALNAAENIIVPLLLSGVKKQDALIQADEILDKLDLSNRKQNFPGELSGGQQQRVAIARAIISKPKLLLADEPTGNLDDKTSEAVIEMFLQLAKDQQIASVIVTHNKQIADKMDKVYELKYGKLERVK